MILFPEPKNIFINPVYMKNHVGPIMRLYKSKFLNITQKIEFVFVLHLKRQICAPFWLGNAGLRGLSGFPIGLDPVLVAYH